MRIRAADLPPEPDARCVHRCGDPPQLDAVLAVGVLVPVSGMHGSGVVKSCSLVALAQMGVWEVVSRHTRTGAMLATVLPDATGARGGAASHHCAAFSIFFRTAATLGSEAGPGVRYSPDARHARCESGRSAPLSHETLAHSDVRDLLRFADVEDVETQSLDLTAADVLPLLPSVAEPSAQGTAPPDMRAPVCAHAHAVLRAHSRHR